MASKERQWKEHQNLRVHDLESSLKMSQEECSSLREQYQQLSEDFQFNLALLDERDRELERYDAIIAKAVTVDLKRQEELSHLCLQVTKLEEQRAKESEERQKDLCKSQHEAAQLRLQLDDLTRSNAGEIQKQTKKYERTKSDLESRIQGLEVKLILQRQEITAAFESELRQREHEFNLKTDEMHAMLLSHNLKVKMLSKKTEIYNQAYLQATVALKAFEESCLQIQSQLHDKDHEVKILTAVKNNRIKELEDELKRMKTKLKMDQDHHIQKYIRDVSSEIVIRDTKMITMQDRETQLRTELERSKETIDRYKQQLSDSLKRESALEQMQVQKDLEWQRLCEDIKAKHYLATEQLIENLTQARDKAEAELKDKKRELQDLIHFVQTERAQAIQDSTSKVDSSPSEEIRHLQEQNSVLRAAVTQMRKDMESLGHLTQPKASQQPGTCANPTPQVTTGSQEHTTKSFSQVSLAGNLYPKNQCPTCGFTKEEVRAAESTLIPIMEQNALVHQLLLENQRLRHQQASGPLPGTLCENAQGAKMNNPGMHSRSKQAAFLIIRLCREKQQLIELANCLRAQSPATGIQAEPVEPEKDCSQKKQGDQHDQLSSLLGKLQYELTAQELQYALGQRVCIINEQPLPSTSNQDPSTNGAARSCSQGHKSTDRSENSKKKDNFSQVSLPQNSLNIQPNSSLPRCQLSSEESMQSLKELWEILDQPLSSSFLSEGDDNLSCMDSAKSNSAGAQMTVHGFSVPVHRRTPAEATQKMNPYKPLSSSAKTSNRGKAGRFMKIRNYNVKD